MKKISSCIFLFAKDYRTNDDGAARGTVFHDIRPASGFKPGDSVEEILGGLP